MPAVRSCHWVPLLLCPALLAAAEPLSHGWATVSELMSFHGKYAARPSRAQIEFAAHHYATITTGQMCNADTTNSTIEQQVASVAEQIKTANPAARVGFYWRTDFALELRDCSGFSREWAAHPEWRLKLDNGSYPANARHYIDFANPAASQFFARAIVNATQYRLGGRRVFDYVFLDGVPGESSAEQYLPGVGPARSKQLVDARYACYASIRAQLEVTGQLVILNSMDTAWDAARHVATGAAGSMFDHWSILQFINRTSGQFDLAAMAGAIELARSPLLANVTTQVKGWPGPIVRQRDIYPPALPSPDTIQQKRQIAAERFNSELALFLLVASELDFWVYSWFWSFDDFVPGNPDSSVPAEFYPEARKPLGRPRGPAERTGSWTYTRRFEHAHVSVDLVNRTNSRVYFEA